MGGSIPSGYGREALAAVHEVMQARQVTGQKRVFEQLSRSSVSLSGDGLFVQSPDGVLLAHERKPVDFTDTFTLQPGGDPLTSYVTVHRDGEEIAVVRADVLGMWDVWPHLVVLSKTGDVQMAQPQIDALGKLVGSTVRGLRQDKPAAVYIPVPGVAPLAPNSWVFFDEYGGHIANLTVDGAAGIGTLLPGAARYSSVQPQNLIVDGPWRAQALQDLVGIVAGAVRRNTLGSGAKTLRQVVDAIDLTGLAQPARTLRERMGLVYDVLSGVELDTTGKDYELVELTAQVGKRIIPIDMRLEQRPEWRGRAIRVTGTASIYGVGGKVGLPMADYVLSPIGGKLQLTEPRSGELFLIADDVDVKPTPPLEL